MVKQIFPATKHSHLLWSSEVYAPHYLLMICANDADGIRKPIGYIDELTVRRYHYAFGIVFCGDPFHYILITY